jgi:uncharacterized glyoxalase superfamily protein PhnB
MARSIPYGLHTVVPSLVLRDCARAIDFYRQAFGAVEVARILTPDGRSVGHAELRFGDSIVFLSDEVPGGPRAPGPEHPSHTSLHVYVDDAAATVARAQQAGARATEPLGDESSLGDRTASVLDPFGHLWRIASHVRHVVLEDERVAAEELDRPTGLPA